MFNIILTTIALLFFILVLMIMMIVVCIYIAIRRGEDLDSDEVKDKYVDIATLTFVILGLVAFIIYN